MSKSISIMTRTNYASIVQPQNKIGRLPISYVLATEKKLYSAKQNEDIIIWFAVYLFQHPVLSYQIILEAQHM